MKTDDSTKKRTFEKHLSDALTQYLDLLDQLVEKVQFVYVSVGKGKKGGRNYPVFSKGDSNIDLPNSPGIYFIYKKGDTVPFYCGESANLNERLKYHFSDSKSAIKDSTLKNQFDDLKHRTLAAMSDMLSLKIIEVPISRKDVEEHFHKRFKINTGRDRKRAKQTPVPIPIAVTPAADAPVAPVLPVVHPLR